MIAALVQRIEDGGELRMASVGAEQLAMADFAGRQPDRGAAHRRLAEIEGRAATTDAAAHHDKAGFRTTDGVHLGVRGKIGSSRSSRGRGRRASTAIRRRRAWGCGL